MLLKDVLLIVPVTLFVAVAAGLDLKFRKIPNLITVPALAVGLVYHLAFGGWQGLLYGLGGFGFAFGVFFVMWLMGIASAGDAKLMAALGGWLGFWDMVRLLAVATVFVAMIGMSVLIVYFFWKGWSEVWQRYVRPFRAQRGASPEERRAAEERWRTRRRIMPYAVPVALATWAILAYKYIWPMLATGSTPV
jgi:prepilin peptidase CpaA